MRNIFKSFETDQMNNAKFLLKIFKVKNINKLIFKEKEFQEKIDNGYLYKNVLYLIRKENKMMNYN